MSIAKYMPRGLMAWLEVGLLALVIGLGVALLNGLACSTYASKFAAASAPTSDRLYQPARMLNGRLCTSDGFCTSALLVMGLLSPDTIEEIRGRAERADPAHLVVCLFSPGGSYKAVSATGILPANVRTCVANVAQKQGTDAQPALCGSACAWLWMAGQQRVIYGQNSVRFHAPYEYAAPACVPGNRLKAALSVAMGWLSDRFDHHFDDAMLATRHSLRVTSLSKGPAEFHPVDAARAVQLGLQQQGAPAATFYVDAPAQATTAR